MTNKVKKEKKEKKRKKDKIKSRIPKSLTIYTEISITHLETSQPRILSVHSSQAGQTLTTNYIKPKKKKKKSNHRHHHQIDSI